MRITFSKSWVVLAEEQIYLTIPNLVRLLRIFSPFHGSSLTSVTHYHEADSPSLTIEEWAAKKDEYRVTAHGIALPFPLLRRNSNKTLYDIYETKVLPSLRRVLACHGIISFTPVMEYRYPPYDKSEGLETLLISTCDGVISMWPAAAKAVLNLFWRHGADEVVDNMQVEIYHPIKYYGDESKRLPNDPLLLESLKNIKEKVVTAVHSLIPQIWTSIAYHSRKHPVSDDAAKPTVIIFCKPQSKANFSLVENEIYQLLKNFPVNIGLEILPGEITSSQDKNPLYLRSIPKNPANGASIGVEGNGNQAATLGGWLMLNLKNPSRQVKCGLTCYHSIRCAGKSTVSNTDTNGILPNDSTARVNIQYPAASDAQKTLKILQELASEDADYKEEISIFKQRMSDPYIGTVVLASGYRLQENHRLDWALFESSKTFTPNRPPPASIIGPRKLPIKRYVQTEGSKVRKIGTFKPGDWVSKQGRTTGVTCGYINELRRDINWVHLNTRSDEWEIMSDYEVFAAPGDPGSMVLNTNGELLGLLFAIDPQCSRLDPAFFTPFNAIQNDVNQLTNGGFLSLD